jgi:hypothetical protein
VRRSSADSGASSVPVVSMIPPMGSVTD